MSIAAVPDPRRDLGAVYTPAHLATWLVTEALRDRSAPSLVLDPAAGDGALLEAARAVAQVVPRRAVDIDPAAIAKLAASGVAEVVERDGLTAGWGLPAGALVVANPPWGARIERARYAGYRVAAGQFDSFDLFVERIVDELPAGGRAAVFLPESLFLHQHRELRRLVTERTTIETIVRFGEGMFPGVSMGCVAVIVAAGAAPAGHRIRTARLTRSSRTRIAAGSSDIATELSSAWHETPQARFALDPACAWDIDRRDERLSLAQPGAIAWHDWFVSGRGLELGRTGELLRCAECAALVPVPRRREQTACAVCGATRWRAETVFGAVDASDSRPVAVGQDVRRHALTPSRSVRTDIAGLDYKTELDGVPRLLVRKTGLGIQAAVSGGAEVTPQAVYHFRPTDAAPDFALDFVAGLLGSRIVNAMHVVGRGQVEWQSHPYVTQQTITAIAIPGDPEREHDLRLMRRVAEAARAVRAGEKSASLEREIELSLAELLGGGAGVLRSAVDVLARTTGSAYLRGLAILPPASA